MSSCIVPVTTPLPDSASALTAGSDLKKALALLRSDVRQLESDCRTFNKEFCDILNVEMAKKIRDAFNLYATKHPGLSSADVQLHPTTSTGAIVPYTGSGEVEQYKHRCQELYQEVTDLKAGLALEPSPCKMCAYLKNVLSNCRLMVMAGGLRIYDEKMDPDYSESRTGYPSEVDEAPCRKRPRTASVSCETDSQPLTLPPITIDPRIAPTQPFEPRSANSDASAHAGSMSSCSPAYPSPSPGGSEDRPPSHESADMRAEMDRLKQELTESKATVKRHTARTQVNEDKYGLLNRQHQKLEEDLLQSRAETAQLTEEHAKLRKKYRGRMAELDRFNNVNKSQKVYIEKLQGEKKARRTSTSGSTPGASDERDIAQLREQLQLETGRHAQQVEELEKKAGICQETSALLKGRTAELSALQRQYAALQSQLEECQNEKVASDAKLSAVENDLRTKEQSLLNQKRINERSAERIKELELDSLRAAREDASAVRESKAEIARLSESLRAEQDRHQEAKSEIDYLRSELIGAKSEIANKENSVLSLKTKVAEIEEAKCRIEDNIAPEKEYIRKVSTELEDLKTQLRVQQQRADAEEQRLSRQVEKLRTDNAKILHAAAEKGQSCQADISNKDDSIEQLQREKDSLISMQTEAARAATRERTALKDEIDSLKAQVKNAQGIAEAEKETLMEVRKRKNAEIGQLQGQLAGMGKIRRKFDDDVKNWGLERANLCKELELCKTQVATLEAAGAAALQGSVPLATYNHVVKDKDSLKSTVTSLMAEREALESSVRQNFVPQLTYNDLVRERDSLKSEVTSSQETMTSLQVNMTSLTSKMTSLQNELRVQKNVTFSEASAKEQLKLRYEQLNRRLNLVKKVANQKRRVRDQETVNGLARQRVRARYASIQVMTSRMIAQKLSADSEYESQKRKENLMKDQLAKVTSELEESQKQVVQEQEKQCSLQAELGKMERLVELLAQDDDD